MKFPTSICNPDTYAAFFRKNAPLLRNFLIYKYGSELEAEDVVQESFIKLWQKCDKVPVEKARSFLYTAAQNLSVSIKRREKIRLTFEKEEGVEIDKSNETPEFQLEEKEFFNKLQRSMENLPERQREAFLLSRIEKKPYKEIAEIMDVSVKAVEKLMHKALLKIKKEIGTI